MARIGFAAATLLSWTAGVFAQEKALVYSPPDEKLPVQVAPQPVAFSHNKHVALGQTCLDCHAKAAEGESAGFPTAAQCMACHATIKADNPKIKKLAAMHRLGEKVKWVRVYRLEGFVFFSHATHLRAKAQCESCHGPVAKRDVLAKEVSIGMVTCMNCHVAKKAPNGCSTCHQLGH